MSANEAAKMLDELEAMESTLSEKDVVFLDDISHRIGEGRELTPVQFKCLRSLYQRVIGDD